MEKVLISDHILRDIRAEIECENGDLIIVKNAKGQDRVDLLNFIAKKIEDSIDGNVVINEEEVVELLMSKLTNIEVDTPSISNPNKELAKVIYYLSSIMQELTWEVLAKKNLQMQLLEKTLLEEDTTRILNDVRNMIKETQQQKIIKEHIKK